MGTQKRGLKVSSSSRSSRNKARIIGRQEASDTCLSAAATREKSKEKSRERKREARRGEPEKREWNGREEDWR